MLVWLPICYGTSQNTDEIKKTQPDFTKKGLKKSIIAEASPGNSAIEPENLSLRLQSDIMLVLDNSGSMKKNDPAFITKDVVSELLNNTNEGVRLGLVIFDQKARLIEHLADIHTKQASTQFLKSLNYINYKGLFTDTPAGVERALYELKANGREDAAKIIILLSDGIIDTGDQKRDAEAEKWLKGQLAMESKKLGIKIFGIAFTDKADFRLMQTLASMTGGEYFRAFTPEDIPDIFKKINALIAKSQAGAASVKSGNLKSVSLEKGHGKVENIKESPPQDRLIPTEGKAAPTPELPAPKNLNETATPENKKPFPGSTSAGKQQPYSTQINYPVIIILLIILIFLLVIYKRQKEEIQSDSLKNLQSSSSAPPPVQAELIDVDHIITHESVSLVLDKRMVRIGRDSGNEIIISREFISSLHATIEYKNGYYFLEDHRSTNGTYLNNRKVSENRPVRLKSGDTIHFAKCEFRFLMHDQAPYGETVMIRTEVE